MYKLDRLKKEARQAAKFHGHDLKHFRTHNCRTSAYAFCSVCGKGVFVDTKPAPNWVDVGGEAVAIDCSVL